MPVGRVLRGSGGDRVKGHYPHTAAVSPGGRHVVERSRGRTLLSNQSLARSSRNLRTVDLLAVSAVVEVLCCRRAGWSGLELESGLWAALRTRPFSSVPGPEATPRSIFVTALDTNPLAPRLEGARAGREADFERGLAVLGKLTDGPVYLCRAPGSTLGPGSSGATVAEFSGKHPAGTVGFHIHTLDPVARDRLISF